MNPGFHIESLGVKKAIMDLYVSNTDQKRFVEDVVSASSDPAILKTAMVWFQTNLYPDQVYTEEQLLEWAAHNLDMEALKKRKEEIAEGV